MNLNPLATAALLMIGLSQVSQAWTALQPMPQETHFRVVQEFCESQAQGAATSDRTPASTSPPNKTTSTTSLNSKPALPKPCTMWIRLWRTQGLTQKKNSQRYTVRLCLTWNGRVSLQFRHSFFTDDLTFIICILN